jgi:hypothetical protein
VGLTISGYLAGASLLLVQTPWGSSFQWLIVETASGWAGLPAATVMLVALSFVWWQMDRSAQVLEAPAGDGGAESPATAETRGVVTHLVRARRILAWSNLLLVVMVAGLVARIAAQVFTNPEGTIAQANAWVTFGACAGAFVLVALGFYAVHRMRRRYDGVAEQK